MSELSSKYIRYDDAHLTDDERDHLYQITDEVGPGLFRIHRVSADGDRLGPDALAGFTAQTVEDMGHRKGGVFRIFDTLADAKADLD